MKPKKLSKKLALNKKTVASLNANDLNNVYGGSVTCYGHDNTCLTCTCIHPTCLTGRIICLVC